MLKQFRLRIAAAEGVDPSARRRQWCALECAPWNARLGMRVLLVGAKKLVVVANFKNSPIG
jgi:hypothetical protein